eukprot:g29058.t1
MRRGGIMCEGIVRKSPSLSTPSLQTHERSMEVISISRSERSILSESSSGLLPAVQEGSEEARLEESNRMDSSNPNSARTNGGRTSSSGRDSTSPRSRSIQFQVLDEEEPRDSRRRRSATAGDRDILQLPKCA